MADGAEVPVEPLVFAIETSTEQRDLINEYYNNKPGYWLNVPDTCVATFTSVLWFTYFLQEWTAMLRDSDWPVDDYSFWKESNPTTVDISTIPRPALE
jgi:hypothetical protein